MTDAGTVPMADTSDMVQFHRVFREAFAAAAPLVGSVPAGDVARAEVVHTYYFNVLRLLKGHHESEDDLLWPRLFERAPAEAETVRRIADQHDGVLDGILASQDRLAEWRGDPQVEAGARLAAALATLGSDLVAHLDEEERVVLPLAAQHMTAPEWGELPAHGMQHFDGDKPWLIIGLIQEQFRPEQVAEMEEHMPPPVAEFWQQSGRAQFQAFVADLRR